MLLEKINLEKELKKERVKAHKSPDLIGEFYQIIKKNQELRKSILNSKTVDTRQEYNTFNFDYLDADKIYHIEQIKKICIDYRLRFLDTKYFKGQIPEEAITKINNLEKQHDIKLKNYKIIAPSKLFKLEDKDDPLLFAAMGNDYYYLVHKWGTDLHPLRKALMLPFKNIINLLILIVALSYIGTFLIPKGLFSNTGSSVETWILGFFIFKIIASITLYYGIAMRKNFNPSIWNNKFI
ncbi:hypothetical protein [Cellulophaga tyrosinoxydans]|uniref:Uncharacterized protein n=1 Tax=Cellulophaga tyrosinoxydans TaxID=504486 RepID=A0A1W1ZXX9_9FLAO|nr:hypothetical protein [Cellulophaga tyrosinoxydans]SMC53305.1 hypothetical protein SAMN05660703_1636 [Cellulophaga tyrosinoxydans]